MTIWVMIESGGWVVLKAMEGIRQDLEIRVKDLEREPSGLGGGRGRVVSLRVLGCAIQWLEDGWLMGCAIASVSLMSSEGDIRSMRILRRRLPVSNVNSFLTLSTSFNFI